MNAWTTQHSVEHIVAHRLALVQQKKEGVKPGGVKPGVVSLLWHYNKKEKT